MYDAKIVGKRIKEMRGGIPQEQCAKELGISRGALSFYENGERKPDADVLFRMSKKFNVSVDYLLGLSDFPLVNERDIETACKVTGLENDYIETLMEALEVNNASCSYTKAFNALFYALTRYPESMGAIVDMVNYDLELAKEAQTIDFQMDVDAHLSKLAGKGVFVTYDNYLDILKYKAQNAFHDVVECISSRYCESHLISSGMFGDNYAKLHGYTEKRYNTSNFLKEIIREELKKEAENNGKHNPQKE